MHRNSPHSDVGMRVLIYSAVPFLLFQSCLGPGPYQKGSSTVFLRIRSTPPPAQAPLISMFCTARLNQPEG